MVHRVRGAAFFPSLLPCFIALGASVNILPIPALRGEQGKNVLKQYYSAMQALMVVPLSHVYTSDNSLHLIM